MNNYKCTVENPNRPRSNKNTIYDKQDTPDDINNSYHKDSFKKERNKHKKTCPNPHNLKYTHCNTYNTSFYQGQTI